MANLVRLIDGREVSSWSDEWRIECLARAIAKKPHIELRRAARANWQKIMSKHVFHSFQALLAQIYNSEVSRVYK